MILGGFMFGFIALLICIILLILSIKNYKKIVISPFILFYLLWSFVIFLSIINLVDLIKPTNYAYYLIIIMLIFFYLGDKFYRVFFKKKKNLKNFFKNKFLLKIKDIFLKKEKYTIIYILSILFIIFSLIDCFIVFKYYFNGTPMSVIRNWMFEPYGTANNPFFSRRSFVEELFRSLVLSPFEIIMPAVAAFLVFNKKEKKFKKIFVLILSILMVVVSSFAGGGGRLQILYYFGCFVLAFLCSIKNQDRSEMKKYFKYIIILLVVGLGGTIFVTSMRTSSSLIEQLYTYFALPPTLLSVWLSKLGDVNHTYGMLSSFGFHSYIFRAFEVLNFDFLIPDLYYTSFEHLLNAEKFLEIGPIIANAFVTPVYYFYIDGGIPFICLGSLICGFLVSYVYNLIKDNLNLKNFVIYALIMYGVFLSFMRLQLVIPSYIISLVMAKYLLYNSKNERGD